MAGAGFYHQLYRLQTPTSTQDAVGQPTLSWSTVAKLRGQTRTAQREIMEAGGTAVRTECTIEAAWHPLATARCRLVEFPSGRVFEIVGVDDPDHGRQQRMIVTAVEVER